MIYLLGLVSLFLWGSEGSWLGGGGASVRSWPPRISAVFRKRAVPERGSSPAQKHVTVANRTKGLAAVSETKDLNRGEVWRGRWLSYTAPTI
ncbi:hypothetical protein AAFF_G00295510 [Aldrovandia affinis]|uniref:Secreted protein n=1 Tax=Aldrovandia affinis TaxID=143900 RepID=A0AAD7R8T8_9TELE|nr:hypothetical protein AAFF_G00295510 [Aldrovandia affinis]